MVIKKLLAGYKQTKCLLWRFHYFDVALVVGGVLRTSLIIPNVFFCNDEPLLPTQMLQLTVIAVAVLVAFMAYLLILMKWRAKYKLPAITSLREVGW